MSLELEQGAIGGLIGPNGAGKTTLFNLITRLYRPNEGRIAFDGKDLTRTPPHRIVRLGIARTFQSVVLFQNMSVLENLLVGAHARLRPFSERRGRKQALETLDYLGLGSNARKLPESVPDTLRFRLLDPAWLLQTRQECDFSNGLEDWSTFGSKGVEIIPDPGAQKGNEAN